MEIIERKEIRVGDVIQVTRTFTVTDVGDALSGGESVTRISSREFADLPVIIPDAAQVWLMHRRVPELPTHHGAMIRVITGSDEGFWMRIKPSFEREVWVSATGSQRSSHGLRELIESVPGRTFEVIR